MIFPAIPLSPNGEKGWYFDGGTRLNTPLKPVLALGADRLIVIAINSLTPRRPAHDQRSPDVFDGATQLIQGLLIDPVVNDLHTLAAINEMLLDDSEQMMSDHERRTKRRRIPYMLIAPEDPDAIGRLAADTYREHYASPRGALRSPNLATLGRLVDAGASATHGELLSYLFYVPEFIEQLIALGRHDAERWLSQSHDLGRWQLGPLPV